MVITLLTLACGFGLLMGLAFGYTLGQQVAK